MGSSSLPPIPEAGQAVEVDGEWIEDTEFDCPLCGSDQFTTYGVVDSEGRVLPVDQRVGHCMDEGGGCGFEWPRTEDWKYFKAVMYRSFKSKEEFESWERGEVNVETSNERGPEPV